jgi:hypothetical protein
MLVTHEMAFPVLPRKPPSAMLLIARTLLSQAMTNSYIPRSVTLLARMLTATSDSPVVWLCGSTKTEAKGNGVGVAVGVAVPVAVGVGVVVGVAVAVGVGVSVAVAVGVVVAVSVGVAVAVSVGVPVAVAVGIGVSVGVAVTVGVAVGVSVGVTVAVAVGVGVGGSKTTASVGRSAGNTLSLAPNETWLLPALALETQMMRQPKFDSLPATKATTSALTFQAYDPTSVIDVVAVGAIA